LLRDIVRARILSPSASVYGSRPLATLAFARR
jgi:hypothetical protein